MIMLDREQIKKIYDVLFFEENEDIVSAYVDGLSVVITYVVDNNDDDEYLYRADFSDQEDVIKYILGQE